MDIEEIKTTDDLDKLLDTQSIVVFSGRRYYTIRKLGRFEYDLQDSVCWQKRFTDLSVLLVQMTIRMAQECE